ncbi:hypothetical protein OH77DRAFT_63747 [Trametes cingulata]|nr:hypothetical protein OH77DRAFT_63747 [Trametes cingulata]
MTTTANLPQALYIWQRKRTDPYGHGAAVARQMTSTVIRRCPDNVGHAPAHSLGTGTVTKLVRHRYGMKDMCTAEPIGSFPQALSFMSRARPWRRPSVLLPDDLAQGIACSHMRTTSVLSWVPNGEQGQTLPDLCYGCGEGGGVCCSPFIAPVTLASVTCRTCVDVFAWPSGGQPFFPNYSDGREGLLPLISTLRKRPHLNVQHVADDRAHFVPTSIQCRGTEYSLGPSRVRKVRPCLQVLR